MQQRAEELYRRMKQAKNEQTEHKCFRASEKQKNGEYSSVKINRAMGIFTRRTWHLKQID